MKVIATDDSQAMSHLSLKINSEGAAIGLVFFGFAGVLEAYLILKSTFLPRILGVIGIVANVGWIFFLYPPLAYRLFPFIAGAGLLGALVQIFWLLVFGVDEERWKERARASAASIWR
jgi:peptidoglycan biosynthesis protein MviN/MurJ (putative lipid II flippase)